jgi:hypothetical protein
MAKKTTTKKKSTKKKPTKTAKKGEFDYSKITDADLDMEEAPYNLAVEYESPLPDDEDDPEPNVVSASVHLSKSRDTYKLLDEITDKVEASGHGLMVTYVEFTLPEALLGKTLSPEQFEKFKKILNDEGRWAELIKELK